MTVPLFDGSTLDGWHPAPRVYGTVYPGGPHVHELFAQRGIEPPAKPEKHPAVWTVESGAIGGFFGNGLASFAAVPFAIRSRRDADGNVVGLQADDPATGAEPVTREKIARLRHAAGVEDFLRVWRWADWNELRVRAVGALPAITTWVNGLKIAELDTATLDAPDYDPDAVLRLLGPRGHLALEVHDNDAMFGDARWGRGAACRWRNIRITE
jgi:hypothetical protein